MRRTTSALALAAALLAALPARAALTTSETEQVRGYVAGNAHPDRVRALVARPDLSAEESAAAMTAALTGLAVDAARVSYLEDLVRNAPTVATRPVLSVASVRGLLARIEALFAQHPSDLERAGPALAEIGFAYGFIASEVAGADTAMNDAARADVAKALEDHLAKNIGLLDLDKKVALPVARLRMQAFLAFYDALPEGAAHRVDAAHRMGLEGARRAALIELGLLVGDSTGSQDRVAQIRGVLEKLMGARDGAEGIFVGDEHATFKAKLSVVSTADALGPLGEASSPWGAEADPPVVDAGTMAAARTFAAVAVHKALERRPGLGVQVEKDGGEAGVATLAAMLAVDAPRTLDVAAARFLAGKKETAAWLTDALGALAAFAGRADVREGLVLALGKAGATHVVLDPAGTATSLRIDGHTWKFPRDASGVLTGIQRNGAPVAMSALTTARVPATGGSSWSGAGLVFARLAGAPKVAIAAGPRVRVVGSTVADAVSTPAAGDDVTVEADIHVDGGAGGLAVRALPAAKTFAGASLLVAPGSPPRAVLLVADGTGNETAAAPPVELPASPTVHVKLALHGATLQATVGATTLTATLPDALAHGDVALRAYPDATLEVTSLQVTGPKKK